MRPPSRRAVLVAASAVALSGCSDVLGGGSPDADAEPVPEFLRPGADMDAYPTYSVDHLVAYGTAENDGTQLVLEPGTESVTDGGTIEFTLHNRTDEAFEHNPYGWSLHKVVDDEWYFLEPDAVPEPDQALEAGGSHEWSLSISNDGVESGRPVEGVEGHTANPVSGLEGGEYAFGTTGQLAGDSYGGRIGLVAPFSVDADPIDVMPTDHVVDTTWEDDVLVAASDRGDADAEYTRLGAYELERVSSAPGARRLFTERVLRNQPLRNVIGLARERDADRVRLEAYDATTPIFGANEEGVYEYDGLTFEITTRELEE